MGLRMRSFGANSDAPSHDTDFSSLEVNPRYKPEGGEPTGDEPQGLEDGGIMETLEATPPSLETSDGLPPEGETVVEDTTSSLNTGTETTGQRLEYTEQEREDLIFSSLSEKLGREIKSYEDLSQAPVTVELDPQIQAINEWKQKTGRPVEDFFKFQKDYAQVSDVDVAREFLQLEYPTFTKAEIELELENFIALEDDLDNEVAKKGLELKKYATKGRTELNKLKAELGTPSEANYTPEVKQKLDFADRVQEQINANKGQAEAYSKDIAQAALSSEGLKLNLAEGLSIDFKITDVDKKAIPTLIDEMPHWRTADGNWNHKAVVEDAIKIKHFDAMIKLAYEQGLNSGKEDILKTAKNSTLGTDVSGGAEQGTGTKKPIIEGLDKILGDKKLTMKFGKK